MLRWPAPSLFPALDVARLLALNEAAAKQLATSMGAFDTAEFSGGACLGGTCSRGISRQRIACSATLPTC